MQCGCGASPAQERLATSRAAYTNSDDPFLSWADNDRFNLPSPAFSPHGSIPSPGFGAQREQTPPAAGPSREASGKNLKGLNILYSIPQLDANSGGSEYEEYIRRQLEACHIASQKKVTFLDLTAETDSSEVEDHRNLSVEQDPTYATNPEPEREATPQKVTPRRNPSRAVAHRVVLTAAALTGLPTRPRKTLRTSKSAPSLRKAPASHADASSPRCRARRGTAAGISKKDSSSRLDNQRAL